MSRDSLDLLLDEYDAWATARAGLIRTEIEDDPDDVTADEWAESDAAGVTLLVRLVGEVQASNRVLPSASSATSGEGAPPIMLATFDHMQADA